MKNCFVNEISEQSCGTDVFLCSNINRKLTKTNKVYLDLILSDKSGSVNGKMWNIPVDLEDVNVGDFVEITYTASIYNDEIQLTVSAMRVIEPESVAVADFYPVSPYDVEKMWVMMCEILHKIENPWYKELVTRIIKSDGFEEKFKKHSAATKVHHAFVGGLLQHTLFVMRHCNSFARVYDLDRDLLVTCAFLHDLGKMKELNEFPKNDYTDAGQLLGHVVMSAMFASDEISKIDGFPETLKENVLHCILSHHGKLEYGSPKVPALKEALALHFADNFDSKMEIAIEGLKQNTTGFNRYLETYLIDTER